MPKTNYLGGSVIMDTIGEGTTSNVLYYDSTNGSVSYGPVTSGASTGGETEVDFLTGTSNIAFLKTSSIPYTLPDPTTLGVIKTIVVKGTGEPTQITSSNISPDPDGEVFELHSYLSNLYIGGNFTTLTDGSLANNVCVYEGTSISNIQDTNGVTGVDATVFSIETADTNVYIGGSFTSLTDGTQSNGVAVYDFSTTTWSNLNNGGVEGVVYGLQYLNSNLYVGGNFTTLNDGTNSRYAALWDGSTWSNIEAGGINGTSAVINAVESDGTNVYFGGAFNQLSDGTPANRIAKWDGSAWSNVEAGGINGVLGAVQSLFFYESNLYVGGDFTSLSDGTSANRIAKWDGSAWSNLDDGNNNGVQEVTILDITENNSNIIVSGIFSKLSSGSTSVGVAMWTGSQWINQNVETKTNAVETHESNLFLGGDFTNTTNVVSTIITTPENVNINGSFFSGAQSLSGQRTNQSYIWYGDSWILKS